jgi:hypothetical protein
MTIFTWLTVIYDVCLAATAVIGWRYGGTTERWGVAILVTGTLVTAAVMDPSIFHWRTHRTPLIVVDGIALAALLMLALSSDRFWPIWATAFHLIALCSHGAVYILPPQVVQAYAIFQGFWVYPIMACILIGTRHHHLDRRRRGLPRRR